MQRVLALVVLFAALTCASRSDALMLINKSVEDLDSVRIRPMIEELVFKSGYRVEDSAVAYWG